MNRTLLLPLLILGLTTRAQDPTGYFEMDFGVTTYFSNLVLLKIKHNTKEDTCSFVLYSRASSAANEFDFTQMVEQSIPCLNVDDIAGFDFSIDKSNPGNHFFFFNNYDRSEAGVLWRVNHINGMMPLQIRFQTFENDILSGEFEGMVVKNPEEGTGTFSVNGRFKGILEFESHTGPIRD